jgi:hypothetical protein
VKRTFRRGQKNKISKHFIQGKTFTGFAFFLFALGGMYYYKRLALTVAGFFREEVPAVTAI